MSWRRKGDAVNIADWLRGLGLEKYAPAFDENAINWDVLSELTTDDLKDIGVAAVGDRRRLLAAIAALGPTPYPGTPALAGAHGINPWAEGPRPGAPLPGLDPAITGEGRVGVEAERRQLTVMFCDLVGSTPLSTRFDPEDLREIVGAYHRCVTDTVARFAGFVAKYMGDGVLVYFGYPEAHEDDVERAARAGLAVIDAVGRLATQEPLAVRIGIATGLVVVGDLIGTGAAQERGVVGETPNLAARLQALARPGTLVVADSTRRQIGTLFEIEDLGPQPLAGFAEPQPAWRVIGESGVVSRFEALRSGATPLVGRDEELDLLLRRWQQARSAEGRVVLVSGEPGIGKSRLTAALSQHIETEPHTRIRYFCSPHDQDSALYPFLGQLERAAGFARDDTATMKLEKLEALLGDGAEPGDLSLIAEMLSLSGGERFPPLDLSPQRKKERTLAALLRQLQALAQRQPVLMIFEDLHWIDPTSRELLDLTIEKITTLPVLLVATYRPEFQPPWVGGSQVTVIALNRLGRSEGATLVHRLAGNLGALPPDIVDEIVERTDGVPLFVEELTKAVVEAGADRGHASIAAVPPSSLAVPATLHASLLGRLDRLGPVAKNVAQVGAAIARDFSYELLAAAAPLAEPELQEALRRLVEAGLVFQRGAPPAAEYLFKHALVQDTAYSTLLRGPRQALHRRIAEALEERFPDLVETRPEIVAHHYGEAAMVDKAIGHWHRAGKLSVAKSAVREATAQLRQGLRLLHGLPETRERNQLELDIHVTLTTALMAGKGYADPEVAAAAGRANRLVTETGAIGTPLHFSVLYGLWLSIFTSGNIAAAREQATNFLSSAQSQPSSGPLLVGHRTLAQSLINNGDHPSALAHAETATSLYRPDEHRDSAFRYGQDIGVSAFVCLSWALWHRGYPDQSARAADRALAYSRELGHAHTLAYALHQAGMVAVFARDVATVYAYSNDCIALASEHGFAQWAAVGRILRGWAAAQQGEATTGIGRIRDGLAAAETTGNRLNTPFYLTLLAETLALAGKIEEGLAALDDALAKVAVSGGKGWNAEIHRLRGELTGRLPYPDSAKAEDSFRTALAIAREQGTRGYELRAATSLARLWHEQGRRGEARDLLEPLYAWFTEGFDTLDLKEAEALLDELN
jgi:class 3 adenylate cyclase/predicted ATPase